LFEKERNSNNHLATFSTVKVMHSFLQTNGLGYILGDFSHTLLFSFFKYFRANAFIYLFQHTNNAYEVITHNSIAMLFPKTLYPGGMQTLVCCL
jgi:hypothetical protein